MSRAVKATADVQPGCRGALRIKHCECSYSRTHQSRQFFVFIFFFPPLETSASIQSVAASSLLILPFPSLSPSSDPHSHIIYPPTYSFTFFTAAPALAPGPLAFFGLYGFQSCSLLFRLLSLFPSFDTHLPLPISLSIPACLVLFSLFDTGPEPWKVI